jgi:hypothetical protein
VAPVAETAIEWLTPVDDVSNAIQDGTAGGAAAAAFNFLPGFKGGKKAAQKVSNEVFDALRSEVDGLANHLASLGGRPKPSYNPSSPLEQRVGQLRDATAHSAADEPYIRPDDNHAGAGIHPQGDPQEPVCAGHSGTTRVSEEV